MPLFHSIRNIVEVKLPSYGEKDPAIVKMYDNIIAGDYDGIDTDNKTDRAYGVLARTIVEWNLVDGGGKPWPITADSIRRLEIDDINALNAARKSTSLSDTKKKS